MLHDNYTVITMTMIMHTHPVCVNAIRCFRNVLLNYTSSPSREIQYIYIYKQSTVICLSPVVLSSSLCSLPFQRYVCGIYSVYIAAAGYNETSYLFKNTVHTYIKYISICFDMCKLFLCQSKCIFPSHDVTTQPLVHSNKHTNCEMKSLTIANYL